MSSSELAAEVAAVTPDKEIVRSGLTDVGRGVNVMLATTPSGILRPSNP